MNAMQEGGSAAYPVVDVRVTVFDGSSHEVDSSGLAFKIAASLAFKAGVRKASSKLLEPVMDVEVVTPEEFLGDIIGDLNARRGHINGLATRAGARVIAARVPLAEMFGYATDLRSLSQGRAMPTLQFRCYQEAPDHVAEELRLNAGKRRAEKETGGVGWSKRETPPAPFLPPRLRAAGKGVTGNRRVSA